MTNIWGFLLQTTMVSFLCLFLLGVKGFYKDRLPPFWQYSLWGVAFAGLLYPVGLNGFYIFKPVAPYIMAAKTTIERLLNSSYTIRENTVYNKSIFPFITSAPVSLTDVLFVIYTLGVIICFLRYMKGYIQLGNIIRNSADNTETRNEVKEIAEKYNLKSCEVKTVQGLPSAFVYGIFRPVLVLPADRETDEKVILHELLHLKYFDLQQKVVWSFFRRLHWPNPFMQYVFNYINNDMESLCDNRALQLLDGEERRDYGRVLLSMINEKYPSAFGTSSISNGNRFIGRRIETIARFKLYPKGMGLACRCMLALILSLAVPVVEATDISKLSKPYGDELPQTYIEKLKLANCATPGGAANVFYSVYIKEAEQYMPVILPEGIEIKEYEYPENYLSRQPDEQYTPFHLLNFIQLDENNCRADFMIRTKHLDENSHVLEWTNYYICPVSFAKQNGSWKIWQTGEYKHYFSPTMDHFYGNIPEAEDYDGSLFYEFSTEYGDIKLKADSISSYKNENTNSNQADTANTAYYKRTFYDFEFMPNDKLTVGEKIGVVFIEMENRNSVLNLNSIKNTDKGQTTNTNYTTTYATVKENTPLISRTYDFTPKGEGLPQAVEIQLWRNSTEKIYSVKLDLRTGDIIG